MASGSGGGSDRGRHQPRHPAGRHQWALAFIRQPTPYTALSFENAGHLPASLAKGAPLDLTFSVTNQEGRDLRYRYLVTSASSGQVPVVLQRGSRDPRRGPAQGIRERRPNVPALPLSGAGVPAGFRRVHRRAGRTAR